jgi:nicotinamidase-related amidase
MERMEKTALLVIDLQRGAFDGVRCPPIDSPEALTGSACALVDAARAGNATVVYVQHSEREPSEFEEGSVHWQLHELLAPADGELRVKKYKSSSFEGTGLDDLLREREVNRLVLCGLQSEGCVSNTARSALELGYAVQVAEDGHGTWPGDDKSAADIRSGVNEDLAGAGVRVVPTERLAEELRGRTAAGRPGS